MLGVARLHMLETVREFARERVAEAGEERAARLRHGEWIVQFLAGEHNNLMNTQTRQAAHERIASEEAGTRLALRFAASADGDHELAWQLFIRFGVALMISYAQTAEVLATYECLKTLPRSADPLRAALALGVRSWARGVHVRPGSGPGSRGRLRRARGRRRARLSDELPNGVGNAAHAQLPAACPRDPRSCTDARARRGPDRRRELGADDDLLRTPPRRRHRRGAALRRRARKHRAAPKRRRGPGLRARGQRARQAHRAEISPVRGACSPMPPRWRALAPRPGPAPSRFAGSRA